ncbi:enolase C-terminal domain-like protein [uncultured Sulfitobacter sp.]|uniref:mandelate racemase/muconate lactonizing enzyme family protein n=1 Tax=uncultured Sulfitobacter sp. TaxID=191468 RepID=UPI002631DF87|nr:enolase C-terminal domain-like protein [uncultured Sulfitobacter sp.]
MSAKITRISVFTHCNDLGGKIWNPAIRWTKKYAVFVCIQDDTGRQGLGECWCFDTAPDALLAFVRTEMIQHFLGTSLEDMADISNTMITRATLTARHGILASALSGIDIAMWDLRAQHARQPIWKTLSPNACGTVNLYASGGLYGTGKTLAMLADEMAGHAQRGFKLSKMKVGGETIQTDVARVHAVLDVLPPDTKLIIDGVYTYCADDALRVFEALPNDRIEAFQSPTKAWDYDGMAQLSKAGVPVMATEAEYRPELHEKLTHDAQVAFLQTAPIACGGISRVTALSRLVADTPTRLSLEVSSTAVALMAACQIAAADPMIAHVEHHSVHSVFFDTLRLQKQANNRHSLPDEPGLGITLPSTDVSTAYSTGDDHIAQLPRQAVTTI